MLKIKIYFLTLFLNLSGGTSELTPVCVFELLHYIIFKVIYVF